MESPLKSTPTKTGRLSLLSSDIDEDSGLIDFDSPQFDFLYTLYFEPVDEANSLSYDEVEKKVDTWPFPYSDEQYFVIKTKTPRNSFGRYNYLMKSVSRTATITKRRNENVDEGVSTTSSKFGTITKRVINPDVDKVIPVSNQLNQTYELLNESCSSQNGSEESSSRVLNRTYELKNENTPKYEKRASNSNFIPNSRMPTINTNTITKSRNANLNRLRFASPYESDNLTNNNHLYGNLESNSSLDQDDIGFDGISNNADLIHRQSAFDKNTSDTDDSVTSSNTRNYPTISRNVTRSLLQCEPNRGQLNNSSQMKKSQMKYTTSSNDDLLNSNTSALSRHSNLVKTSSIAGRSEPNLCHNLTRAPISIQNKKSLRPSLCSNKSITQSSSKIARPLSQNGPLNGNGRKVSTKLQTSNSRGFGSITSLPQSNMARATSQTSVNVNEDEDPNMCFHRSSSKISTAISRNSTFRVHRPTPIVNVTSVFADQPDSTSTSIRYNSDDNILHCSQDEVNQFRAKVLNSSSCSMRPTTHGHQVQQTLNHHQTNAYTRSDSPSSNSSTCSSSSSSSRMKVASNSNLINRLNNNGTMSYPLYSANNNDSTITRIGSKDISNNNNNSNSCIPANNNLLTNCIQYEMNTNFNKSNCRIPSLPKTTVASNRSGIPVSGTIPKSHPGDQTMVRKSKLLMPFPDSSANKVNQFMSSKIINDNSWQNDCF